MEAFIRDLQAGMQTEWLGFHIRKKEGSLKLGIAEKAWRKLERKFQQVHEEPDAPIRVPGVIRGWLQQMGPASPEDHQEEVFARMTGLAQEEAFEELPSRSALEAVGRKAYRDWDRIQEEQRSVVTTRLAGGSAAKDRFSAAGRRRAGERISSVPQPAASLFTMHTDGCCLPSRSGGWAYRLTTEATGDFQSASGATASTTNNAMELMAVINGLKQVPAGAAVTLVSDSKYVCDGITQHLPTWRNRQWKGGPPAKQRRLVNAELWEQLSDLVRERNVHVAFVRGHSGDARNEQCDRMAFAAAAELDSKPTSKVS